MNDFLYCYHGEYYDFEAKDSIKSLQKLGYKNITVIKPSDLRKDAAEELVRLLPMASESHSSGFAYKVNGISSYDSIRFIYLDTDTYVAESLDDLIDATAYAGIVGVADPLVCTFKHIDWLRKPDSWLVDRPAIPEINTGVLGINKNLLPPDFMSLWKEKHRELCECNGGVSLSKIPDQPSLRQALIELNVVPLLLGSEYNFRSCYPQALYKKARIHHVHANAYSSHRFNAGCDGDITLTTPWGLNLRRAGLLNRGLFYLGRMYQRLIA